jgi:hypothetical protein
MEEFTAYTVERIKGKKNNLVFNISCDVVFNSFKTLKYAQRSKAIALYAAVLNSTSNSMHTAFHDFEEYCDNLCDWYNIYDKEQLKADIEDAYHSQEITN